MFELVCNNGCYHIKKDGTLLCSGNGVAINFGTLDNANEWLQHLNKDQE